MSAAALPQTDHRSTLRGRDERRISRGVALVTGPVRETVRRHKRAERDADLQYQLESVAGDVYARRGLTLWPLRCGCVWHLDDRAYQHECAEHAEAA